MFKTLFNIVLIIVGLGTSAHASDYHVFKSEFNPYISVEDSGNVHEHLPLHHSYFDVQTETFRVVSNPEIQPSQPTEISINKGSICNACNYRIHLQCNHFIRAAHGDFKILHLKKVLYPFHSFW